MLFPLPILEGVLERRYNRFLADVILPGGERTTAHCPNTGSMKTCWEVGAPVLLSDHGAETSRKLRYTLEACQMGGHWVGVNTMTPNRVVEEAVRAGRIPELAGFSTVKREVKYGENSRIDLLLSHESAESVCYVEVKNTTLREGESALFPDAITERGLKHVQELANVVRRGHRGVMLFFVNRSDCEWMGPADTIDAAYGKALRAAVSKGVEVLAYRAETTLQGITLGRRLSVRL